MKIMFGVDVQKDHGNGKNKFSEKTCWGSAHEENVITASNQHDVATPLKKTIHIASGF